MNLTGKNLFTVNKSGNNSRRNETQVLRQTYKLEGEKLNNFYCVEIKHRNNGNAIQINSVKLPN